jgi:hypothetical protein
MSVALVALGSCAAQQCCVCRCYNLLCSGDPFEELVNAYLDNRSKRLASRLGSGMRSSISRFTAFVKKHRRTESQQHLSGFLNGGSSSAAGGFSGGSSGMGSAFGGGLSGLADSPEVQRLKQLAAAFASAAVGVGQMRRNLTEGSNLGKCSATESVRNQRMRYSRIVH